MCSTNLSTHVCYLSFLIHPFQQQTLSLSPGFTFYLHTWGPTPPCFSVPSKAVHNSSPGNVPALLCVSPEVPLLMDCASHSLCTHFLLNFNFFLEVPPHQARSGNPFSKLFPLAWAMNTCEYKHFSLEEITGFLQLQTHVALSVHCQTLLYFSFISPKATCFCTLVNFCLSFFSFSCCVSFNPRSWVSPYSKHWAPSSLCPWHNTQP